MRTGGGLCQNDRMGWSSLVTGKSWQQAVLERGG